MTIKLNRRFRRHVTSTKLVLENWGCKAPQQANARESVGHADSKPAISRKRKGDDIVTVPLKLSYVEAQANEIFHFLKVNDASDVENEIKPNAATLAATNDNHEASITTKKSSDDISECTATITIVPITATHFKESLETIATGCTITHNSSNTDSNGTTNKIPPAASSLISLATTISKEDAEKLLELYPDELNKSARPNLFKIPSIPSYRRRNKFSYRSSSKIQNRHGSRPYEKINNGSGTFTVTSLPLAFSKLSVKDEIRKDDETGNETAKAQKQPQLLPSTMKSTPELQYTNGSRRLIKIARRRLVGNLNQIRSEIAEKIASYSKRLAEIRFNSSFSFKDERLQTKAQKRKRPVDDLYEHPCKKRLEHFDTRKLHVMPLAKERCVEEEKISEQLREKEEEKTEFSIKEQQLKVLDEKEMLKTEEKIIKAEVREINKGNHRTVKASLPSNSIGRKRKSATEINLEAETGYKVKMRPIEMKVRELCRKLSLLCLGVSPSK